MAYYIYILASKQNGTLYIGVTSNLIKRVWEHKNNKFPENFPSKYNVKKLVYYETCEDISSAILREKQLKAGNRQTKLGLINNFNFEWKDLYESIIQ